MNELCDALQFFRRYRCTRRVGRGGQQHATCVLAPSRFNLGARQLKAFISCGRYQHCLAFSGADEMPVARVAGVRHQHLVACLDQRKAGQLQRGRCTSRHDDATRFYINFKTRCIPGTDFFTQFAQACRLGVLGVAVGYRLGSSGLYQRRRCKVWLADVQKNHRLVSMFKLFGHGGCCLGNFHHIKRLYSLGALCDSHDVKRVAVCQPRLLWPAKWVPVCSAHHLHICDHRFRQRLWPVQCIH